MNADERAQLEDIVAELREEVQRYIVSRILRNHLEQYAARIEAVVNGR